MTRRGVLLSTLAPLAAKPEVEAKAVELDPGKRYLILVRSKDPLPAYAARHAAALVRER